MDPTIGPIPSLEDFLNAPRETVAPLVPRSLIFAAGGTRRDAALAGVSFKDYPEWNRPRMLEAYTLLFQYGVQHLIAPVTHPRMFQEAGLYGSKMLEWLRWAIAGPETTQYYQQAGWQVRLVVLSDQLDLSDVQQHLAEATQAGSAARLWYTVVPDYERMWTWILEKVRAVCPRTRSETVRALFGEEIDPVQLLISFGKPTVSPDILPPFLVSTEAHSYWMQTPSYRLDDVRLRQIIYDYAYTRHTWRSDKTGREQSALAYREAWENGLTLGVGVRLGEHWYPQPFQAVKYPET